MTQTPVDNPALGLATFEPKERSLFNKLAAVTDNSMWGFAIRLTLEHPSIITFLRLVLELKSQQRDNPELMRRILGNAYEDLVNF